MEFQDGTKAPSFKLFVSQVLHNYDHHYVLDFRFDLLPSVTNTKTPGKFMHAYIYITSQSFKDANATSITFHEVDEETVIPKKLLESARTKDWLYHEKLRPHALDLTYGSLIKTRETAFSVDAPYGQEVLEHLCKLEPTSGQITLFFNTNRLSEVESFIDKIENNSVRPPLYHYYHGKENFTHPR